MSNLALNGRMEAPPPQESLPTDASQKLIRIVDHDESILEFVEYMIKKEGFRTDRAIGGIQALRKVSALSPDLIILDFMLAGSGMGGYEVLRELQASGSGNIPVIVITGRRHMDDKAIEKLRLEPNVREFMEMPLQPAIMSAALHSLLRTRLSDRA